MRDYKVVIFLNLFLNLNLPLSTHSLLKKNLSISLSLSLSHTNTHFHSPSIPPFLFFIIFIIINLYFFLGNEIVPNLGSGISLSVDFCVLYPINIWTIPCFLQNNMSNFTLCFLSQTWNQPFILQPLFLSFLLPFFPFAFSFLFNEEC